MLRVACCRGCLEKMIEIDRLKKQRDKLRRDNARLKEQLGRRDRTIHEAPFGSSTPSSKRPVKPNSPEENRRKVGGAKQGHPGHGRPGADSVPNAPVCRLSAPALCPHCGGSTTSKDTRRRLVVDCVPMQKTEMVYHLGRRICSTCGRTVAAEPPGVLPRCLYGNRLLTYVATEHYLNGMTLGQIEARTGIGCGSPIEALHRALNQLAGDPAADITELLFGPDPAPCDPQRLVTLSFMSCLTRLANRCTARMGRSPHGVPCRSQSQRQNRIHHGLRRFCRAGGRFGRPDPRLRDELDQTG